MANIHIKLTMTYDLLKVAAQLERIVTKENTRKYYRFRADRWYGGIATADCVGCPLKCVFCWSDFPRDRPRKAGKFYTPEDVFNRLDTIARKHNLTQLRISGNEPTLGKGHLLKVLELVERSNYSFMLETSGVLVDEEYAKSLAPFRNIHARVSLKGTTPEEFSKLTGASPGVFKLQLNAIAHCLDASVSVHPSAMLSFSSNENIQKLLDQLEIIKSGLSRELEEEYVILYPNVIKKLKGANVKPRTAYKPDGVPAELI